MFCLKPFEINNINDISLKKKEIINYGQFEKKKKKKTNERKKKRPSSFVSLRGIFEHQGFRHTSKGFKPHF